MKLRGSRYEDIAGEILRLRVGVKLEETDCAHRCSCHEVGPDSLARRLLVWDMETSHGAAAGEISKARGRPVGRTCFDL